MRATWLTDLHLNFLDETSLKVFATEVMAEKPDVLLVTGDTGEAFNVCAFLDMLALIAPVHAVLGNHDFYRSTIAEVRERAHRSTWYLPARGPVRLGNTTLVGVDGWGDARCGNLDSDVKLADWQWIGELDGLLLCPAPVRCAKLQALGSAEAAQLSATLERVGDTRELIVLTHVPPFADACWYNGARSSPDWLPWFSCIAVGDVLLAYARAHPATTITVLCGHTHGKGEHRAAANLLVRTGGWNRYQKTYGNPIVQSTLTIT
jgi:predicted phosphohydrolase